jgi:hypothetical protein
MIDAEVLRLRKLRNSALGARALAFALDPSGADEYCTRSAVLSWRVVRLTSGRLSEHPFPDYQRSAGALTAWRLAASARVRSSFLARFGRGHSALLREMEDLTRALNDVRSLTLAPHLSDALGRAHGALQESLARGSPRPAVQPFIAASSHDGQAGGAGMWPYLGLAATR